MEILAANVSALMARHGLKARQVEELAKVDKNTVTSMATGKHATRINKIEAVARAFGLQAWELLVRNGEVFELIRAYEQATEEGKKAIAMIAAMAPKKSE